MIKPQAACGSWQSPMGVEMLTDSFGGFSHTMFGHAHWLIWSESKPQENGRAQIIARDPSGKAHELLPMPMNASTRVHEYGGGAWCVDPIGGEAPAIYFSNDDDAGLYFMTPTKQPQLLWKENQCWLADIQVVNGKIFAIMENHAASGEPKASVITIDNGKCRTLLEGDDFYGSLAINADASQIACISWSHPAMPWDHTKLHLIDQSSHHVFEHPTPCAIQQPCFTPDGRLLCIADIDGWWQICAVDNGKLRPCLNRAQTHGREAGLPLWQFGMRSHALINNGDLIVAHTLGDRAVLSQIDPNNSTMRDYDLPFTNFAGLRTMTDAHGNPTNACIAVGYRHDQHPQIIAIEGGQHRVLHEPEQLAMDPEDISIGQPITFPTGDSILPQSQWPDAAICADATKQPTHAHAFYYPPTNQRFAPLDNERPPLIVKCHGGPTGRTNASLHLKTQFFTSRGFGVVDVNYRGSTGFGRNYREALYNQWGIADVQDCAAVVQYLTAAGLCDPKRTIITGSSAGGYTVLSALAFADVFRSACSAYGIGELQALVHDTHKFESRYLDQLLGPFPQFEARYHARSPLFHAHKIACPVLFLQGSKDKIVPPQQAKSMCKALQDAGQTSTLVMFDEEGHGFRRAASIRNAILHELWFYADTFGFAAHDNRPQKHENPAL